MGYMMPMDRKALISILVAAMLTIASFSVYVFVFDDDDPPEDPSDPVDVVPFRGKENFKEVPYETYLQFYHEEFDDVCYYTDDFFRWPSTAYDHSLAVASCCFARAVFSSSEDWYGGQLFINGEEFLEAIGFDSITPNEDYLSKAELDTIGALIGKKTISCESENDTTVIALGLRGDGYGIEWASNMLVGTGEDSKGHHKGFYDSQTKVMDFLKRYIEDEGITGDIKIWMTGFSRAAAVSNLTAGIIDTALANGERPFGNDVNLSKEDLYVYTMGTPAGVYYDGSPDYPDPHSEDYNNIRSILVFGDMVPKLMLEGCNFHRYGIDIIISDMGQEDYDERKAFVVEEYNSIETVPDIDSYFTDTFQPYRIDLTNIMDFENLMKIDEDSEFTSFDYTLDFLFDGLSEKMGGREGFMEMFQEDFTEIFEILAGESRSCTIEDFAITIAPMLMDMISVSTFQLIQGILSGDISELIEDPIREALTIEGGYANRASEMADRISDVLFNIVDLIIDDEDLMNAVATMVMNGEDIAHSHNVLTYHLWLKSTDPNYTS